MGEFDEPDIPRHLAAAVEALLFAAEGPLDVDTLRETVAGVDETEIPAGWIEATLADLQAELAEREGGIGLVEVAGAWELRTRPLFAEYVRSLYKRPPVRLSRAALEVLAVVAYRQPCTRADVEDIRGVDCSGVLRLLLERGLIKILGKADEVGRPLIYGTSDEFLSFFGLASLGDLPTLREYTELTEEHVVQLQELDETLAANVAAQRVEDSRDGHDDAPTLPGADAEATSERLPAAEPAPPTVETESQDPTGAPPPRTDSSERDDDYR